MEYDDTITVLSGLVEPLFVEKLIECYKDVKHKLVSTWNTSDKTLLEQLESNGFHIVLSDYPEHRTSANYQIVCLQNGIHKATQLGFTYVCRSRTDVFPKNHLQFLKVIRDLYIEKVTVLCGVSLFNMNYYLDIVICGTCEQLLAMFSKLQQPTKHYKNPELYFLQNYTECEIQSQADIKQYLHFAKKKCIEANIEIMWYRPYDCVPFPRSIPYTKVLAEYCNAFFIYD